METPKVIDFRVKPASEFSRRIRYLRIALNNVNGSELTLSAASQLAEFKIPSVPLYLSESILSYSIEMPAVANKVNWAHEDLSLGEAFKSVQFGTAGSLNLCDLQHMQNYMKTSLKMFTPYEEFISRDPLNSYYPANIMGVSAVEDANKPNILMSKYTMQANDNYDSDIAAGDSFKSPFKLTDPKYTVRSGPAVGPIDAGGYALVRNRQLRLGDIKKTIFSEDKLFYSPLEMYLRFQTNELNRVGCASAALENPSDAVASLSADTKLKNVYLYLAIETNKVLIDEIKNSVLGGQHRFRIPFTVAFRHGINAAGNSFVQIPITSQYGKKLHDVFFTVANNNELLNTACDSSNWNGSKVENYQIYLDQVPMTDNVIECKQALNNVADVKSDDWRENRNYIRNKLMNYGQYQLNWFAMQGFYDPITGDDSLDLTTSEAGLDLEAVRLLQLQLKTASACNIYTYCTFLRDVIIDPTGQILFG